MDVKCQEPKCEYGYVHIFERKPNGKIITNTYVKCEHCKGSGQEPEIPGQESMFG